MASDSSWKRFRALRLELDKPGLSLDLSRVRWPEAPDPALDRLTAKALDEMDRLESGEPVNTSENRRVGHYWLRAPERSPDDPTRDWIVATRRAVEAFAASIHAGELRPQRAERFTRVLLIGIGGSVLGPQLVHDALGERTDSMEIEFLDNTDPVGFERVLGAIGDDLERTLTLVVSKSGRTPETRNGMLEARVRYEARALDFAGHAVAITAPDSDLDRLATREKWLGRFPMADWIGGRTSWASAVGMLPAALAGFDVDAMLRGAAEMDALTRVRPAAENPAALMARAWFVETGGRGDKQMVVLPYRDRLVLLPRYLQQLIMESLGKKHDRAGRVVHQGLTVYGNKGSTDQHAFVQQLRDGRADVFVTFVQVLDDGIVPVEIEPGITSADYLAGFLLGTREALWESGRDSILLTLRRLDAAAVGALLALFERSVGLYASMIDVNAYDQPGVEAGKKAATALLSLQKRIQRHLEAAGEEGETVAEIAAALDAGPEMVFLILERLATAPGRGVRRRHGSGPYAARYAWESGSRRD